MNKAGVKLSLFLILFTLGVTESRGQSAFDDRYIYTDINLRNGLPSSFVDDVIQDDAGFLWIATSGGGLCRYDGYELLTMNSMTDISLGNNFTRNLALDPFGRLWVSTEAGLDIIDTRSLREVDLDLGIPEADKGIMCSYVTMDSKGAMWAQFESSLFRVAFTPDGSVENVSVIRNSGLGSLSGPLTSLTPISWL